MPTILGFFTALFVVAWGTRWYLSRTSRDWPATLRRWRAALAHLRTLATPPQREATAPVPTSRLEPERGGEVVIEGEASPSPAPSSAAVVVEVEEVRPPRAAPAPSAALPEIVIEAAPSPVPVEPPPPAPAVAMVPVEATAVSEKEEMAVDEVGAAWQEVADLATPTPATSEGQEGEAVTETVIGFCARCRDKRPVAQPTRTRTKKGKPAIRGQCSVCGAGMFVFTGS